MIAIDKTTISGFAGDYDKAAGLLADFDRRYPGYGIIALRRIGIERRYASRHSQELVKRAYF